MNVLSLFDGMSCGQIALHRAGFHDFLYYASEIDPAAIKVTRNNYPSTIHIGDVTEVHGNKLPHIDLLIGGSPCQGFSFAGKQLMARIKSTGNKSTELAFMRLLRRMKISGWRRHAKVLGIRPDFVFAKTKIVVFVDGCFWHGCPEHSHFDRLKHYWLEKIARNMMRDNMQMAKLHRGGWKVRRVWEHSLKEVAPC